MSRKHPRQPEYDNEEHSFQAEKYVRDSRRNNRCRFALRCRAAADGDAWKPRKPYAPRSCAPSYADGLYRTDSATYPRASRPSAATWSSRLRCWTFLEG